MYDYHSAIFNKTSPFADNFRTPNTEFHINPIGGLYAVTGRRVKDLGGFHEKRYSYFLRNVEN